MEYQRLFLYQKQWANLFEYIDDIFVYTNKVRNIFKDSLLKYVDLH